MSMNAQNLKAQTDLISGIASGLYINIREASVFTGVPYFTLRRRLIRDGISSHSFRRCRYVHVGDLANPSLRVR